MKKFRLYLTAVLLHCFLLQSCVKDNLKSSYTYFLPVYKIKTEVWQTVKSTSPQPLQKTGKLFLFGKYIFINELDKGVHIIDNSNPASPKNISFINIPGNVDLAVKDNTMYADIYTDLATIDITDPSHAVLRKINEEVFAEKLYLTGGIRDTSKYIVAWEKHVTTNRNDIVMDRPVYFPGVMIDDVAMSNISKASGGIGIAGSMARFTILNNYLYTVGLSNLSSFNISVSMNPVLQNTKSLGWNIETIYPLNNKLFIGSKTGMSIFSTTDPVDPVFVGTFSHACFNDPVIADDKYAYVTLRATDQSGCWGGTAAQRNELDIVDIADLLHPSLITTYDMNSPKGLSKDGDRLFICDGSAGLKIYDTKDVGSIKLLKVIRDISPFDVICQGGLAIVVAEQGIYEYDYSNTANIKLLSKIAVD